MTTKRNQVTCLLSWCCVTNSMRTNLLRLHASAITIVMSAADSPVWNGSEWMIFTGCLYVRTCECFGRMRGLSETFCLDHCNFLVSVAGRGPFVCQKAGVIFTPGQLKHVMIRNLAAICVWFKRFAIACWALTCNLFLQLLRWKRLPEKFLLAANKLSLMLWIPVHYRSADCDIFTIQILSWFFKTQSKSNHSPKFFSNAKSKSKIIEKCSLFTWEMPRFFFINSVQIRSGSKVLKWLTVRIQSKFNKICNRPDPVRCSSLLCIAWFRWRTSHADTP